MNHQLSFILSTAALISLAACSKHVGQTGPLEPDGAVTLQTKSPVAGTANDLAAGKTIPGKEMGVTSPEKASDVHANQVNARSEGSVPDATTDGARSGTSVEVNSFDSATTGAQNSSGTTSGARTNGKTSSGTSTNDGSWKSKTRSSKDASSAQ